MIEYIVDNQVVELGEESVIELNMSINDIRNPITINNTWSKQIDIPGTNRNNKIFGYIFDNNIEVGYNPNIKKDVEIRVNSIPVIVGYQKINDIVLEGGKIIYKVIIYGNNTTIFEDMGDDLITDLDLSEYDHLYTKENVENSWSGETGYFYPFINYDDKKWGWEDIVNSGETYIFFPSFHVKTIVDKIFQTYGYEYDSTFFNSDLFKSLVIPYTNSTGEQQTEMVSAKHNIGLYFFLDEVPDPPIMESFDIWDTNNLYDPLEIYPISMGRNRLRTPADGIWTIHVSGQNVVSEWHYFTGCLFSIFSRRMDIPGQPITLEYSRNIWGATDPQDPAPFEFSFTFPKILKDRDLWISTIFYYMGDDNETTEIEFDIDWELQTDRFFYNLTEVKPSETLPKIQQRELFDCLNKMFNLYVERNPDNPTELTIEPFPDYYERSTGTYDWTYKVDWETKKYKLMSELNSNSFNFKYKDDNDFHNQTYIESLGETAGEITTFVQSNFIKEDLVVELPASPSIIDNFHDNLIYPTIVKDPNNENPQINTKWNWRIMSRNTLDSGEFPFNSKTFEKFPTCSHLFGYDGTGMTESLWFDYTGNNFTFDMSGTTIYEKYWDGYLDLIKNQNSKLLTIETYLSEKDLSNLRFYERIFINDNYYYLNNIIFNPLTKKSKSELLLIPSTEIRTILFSNFQFIGQNTYVVGDKVNLRVDVSNFSQTTGTYGGEFQVKDSDLNILHSYPFGGDIPKNRTITIDEEIQLLDNGLITFCCVSNDGHFQEGITLFISQNPYEYSNLRKTAPNGLYTGFDIIVEFDIQAVESTHSGTTSGFIDNENTSEQQSWTWTSSGLGSTTITKTFTLGVGTNTFKVSGDWEAEISVFSTNPSAVLSDAGWLFNPPSGWEQGDSVQVSWGINNTGQIPSDPISVIFDITYDQNGINPIDSYSPIIINNEVIPVGGKSYNFTLNNLPFDEVGSANHIYIPTPIYLFVDAGPVSSANSLTINPCGDDVEADNMTIFPTNITGDTTEIRFSYDVINNSCKDIIDYTWYIQYRYFDQKLGLKKIIPFHTTTLFLPEILTGDSITIPQSFTSYTPPNTWSVGEKSVEIIAENFMGQKFPLITHHYNYWVGVPDIQWISSVGGADPEQGVFWLNLTAKNEGNAGGNAYITASFRRPNGTTIINMTTQNFFFNPNQTRTLIAGAYSFSSGVYGNYQIVWTFRNHPSGSIIQSGTTLVYRPIYNLDWDSNGNVVWSGGSDYDSGNKQVNVNIKISALCSATSFTSGDWFGQAQGFLYDGGTSIGNVQAYCLLSNQLGQDCSDFKTGNFTINNVQLGDSPTGTTSINTLHSIFCEQGQFGESGGWVEFEITGGSGLQGDIQITGSGNKKRFECW